MIRKISNIIYISVLAVVLFVGMIVRLKNRGVERLLLELWQVMPIRH